MALQNFTKLNFSLTAICKMKVYYYEIIRIKVRVVSCCLPLFGALLFFGEEILTCTGNLSPAM